MAQRAERERERVSGREAIALARQAQAAYELMHNRLPVA